MKSDISALDLYFLMKEIKNLEGAKLDKVFNKEDDKHNLLFQFHKTGQGKLMFRVNIPQAVYFTHYKFETAQIPGNFAIFLRRWLSNSRVKKIKQKGFDRLLEIEFEVLKNDEKKPYYLIIELVSPGNILLLNEEKKIINLMQPQKHGERLLRGGAIYKSFKESFDLINASEEEIIKVILESDKDSLVKKLAIDLSLSGVYAEEICHNSGLDKNLKEISNKDAQNIVKEIKKLLSKDINPCLINKEVFPFELNTKKSDDQINETNEIKSFETFSEAIDELLGEKEYQQEVNVAVKETKKSLNKIEKVAQKQRLLSEGLAKSEKENQEKGELIYKNYNAVKGILEAVKKARETMSWKEIKEQLNNPIVKKIDEKNKEIVLELE